MRRITRASNVVRFTLVITALLLPSLSLIPLGGLYLWEHGLLLWWALGAFLIMGVVFGLQRWVLVDVVEQGGESRTNAADALADPSWNAAEEKAWSDVKALSARVTPESISDPKALLDLTRQTIDAVALRLHPGKNDPIWQFTLPEALLISERVSGRLNVFVSENIPFGDRLTVSQFLAVYRWRNLVDVAERGYNIWRIIRLTNPAAAATNEARERLSRALFYWGREQVSRRFASAVVEEVGRAAIDLYSGRLKASRDLDSKPDQLFRANFEAFAKAPLMPLNVMIFGGSQDDRAAVGAQLSKAQREASTASKTLRQSAASPMGGTEIALVTSDGNANLEPNDAAQAALTNSDVFVWIVSGPSPLTENDKATLKRLSDAASPHSASLPPMLIPTMPAISFGDESTEAQWASAAAQLHKAIAERYPGPVGKPARFAIGQNAARHSAELWDAVSNAVPHALRIQFVRHLEKSKKSGGMMQSVAQATSAVVGLAKAAITRH